MDGLARLISLIGLARLVWLSGLAKLIWDGLGTFYG